MSLSFGSRVENTALVLVTLLLNATGLDWGLPSTARSKFYPSSSVSYEMPESDARRLYQTAPYESYHPDEGVLLKYLAAMQPSHMDFNPRRFNYPTFWVYVTGATLKLAQLLGFAELHDGKSWYVKHPDAMARIYLIGRMLAAFTGILTVLALAWALERWFGRVAGFVGGLTLALTPLWVRDVHFMLINVPAAFLSTLAAISFAESLRRERPSWLMLGFVFAGLAASTKYPAGAVGLVGVLVALIGFSGRASRLITQGVATAALAFFVGTPYALITPRAFLRDVLFEGQDKLGLADLGGVGVGALTVYGPGIVAVTVACVVLIGRWSDWRSRLILVWIVAGGLHRMLTGHEFLRYWILVLPAVAASIGAAAHYLWRVRRWRSLVLASVALMGAYSVNLVACLRGADVRDEEAAAIDRMASTDSSVGFFSSFYFDTPPVSSERHDLIDLTTHAEASPQVVVAGILRSGAQRAWWSRHREERYSRIVHEHGPWPGWRLWVEPGQDWYYTFPRVETALRLE